MPRVYYYLFWEYLALPGFLWKSDMLRDNPNTDEMIRILTNDPSVGTLYYEKSEREFDELGYPEKHYTETCIIIRETESLLCKSDYRNKLDTAA